MRWAFHSSLTQEGVCWWAESDDLPGFTAAGSTLEELREMYTTEVGDRPVTEILERESVILTVPGMEPLVVSSTHSERAVHATGRSDDPSRERINASHRRGAGDSDTEGVVPNAADVAT